MNRSQSPWGKEETEYFYQLTPDRILDAVERSLGVRCTGRSFAHNSLENRVYELEIEAAEGELAHRRSRVAYENFRIVKFYRPGRWTKEQILEEHQFLLKLVEQENPVVAPLRFQDGQTLHQLPDMHIYYAVFPKVGGRSPQELSDEQVERVGRLLARMHQVGASLRPQHRIQLNPGTYGWNNLQYLLDHNILPESIRQPYQSMVEQICHLTEPWFAAVPATQIHGDCHLGNLLWGDEGPFWVDFDDSVIGPPVQDLWLMVPGRDESCRLILRRLIQNYEMLREFDWSSLRLIEALRALRLIHFSAWIAKRRQDPAFIRAFPDFGTEHYWQVQLQDLREQLDLLVNDPQFWLH
ncbi:MAG: serine/threonine protein kinase [Oligoflexus sp.]